MKACVTFQVWDFAKKSYGKPEETLSEWPEEDSWLAVNDCKLRAASLLQKLCRENELRAELRELELPYREKLLVCLVNNDRHSDFFGLPDLGSELFAIEIALSEKC